MRNVVCFTSRLFSASGWLSPVETNAHTLGLQTLTFATLANALTLYDDHVGIVWLQHKYSLVDFVFAMRKNKEDDDRQKMAPRSGSRRERNGVELETIGETGSGLECMVESCWRPVPQEGRQIKALID